MLQGFIPRMYITGAGSAPSQSWAVISVSLSVAFSFSAHHPLPTGFPFFSPGYLMFSGLPFFCKFSTVIETY
jgi:hypothetical protein